MTVFIRAAEVRDVDEIAQVLRHAGEPRYSGLFGSEEDTLVFIRESLRRPSSELALEHVKVAVDDDHDDEAVVGAYAAFGADRLFAARAADAFALLRLHPETRGRLDQVSSLPSVRAGSWYLSKIGVAAGRRGEGIGHALLDDCLTAGRASGYGVVTLHVHVENAAALALYRDYGFDSLPERSVDGYVALELGGIR